MGCSCNLVNKGGRLTPEINGKTPINFKKALNDFKDYDKALKVYFTPYSDKFKDEVGEWERDKLVEYDNLLFTHLYDTELIFVKNNESVLKDITKRLGRPSKNGVQEWDKKALGIIAEHNVIEKLPSDMIGEGEEVRVYDAGDRVLKIIDYDKTKGLYEYLNKVIVLDALFPQLDTKIEGVYYENGEPKLVVSQKKFEKYSGDFADETLQKSIDAVPHVFIGYNVNGGDYHIWDINNDNVMQDGDGVVVLVDAEVEFNGREIYQPFDLNEDGEPEYSFLKKFVSTTNDEGEFDKGLFHSFGVSFVELWDKLILPFKRNGLLITSDFLRESGLFIEDEINYIMNNKDVLNKIQEQFLLAVRMGEDTFIEKDTGGKLFNEVYNKWDGFGRFLRKPDFVVIRDILQKAGELRDRSSLYKAAMSLGYYSAAQRIANDDNFVKQLQTMDEIVYLVDSDGGIVELDSKDVMKRNFEYNLHLSDADVAELDRAVSTLLDVSDDIWVVSPLVFEGMQTLENMLLDTGIIQHRFMDDFFAKSISEHKDFLRSLLGLINAYKSDVLVDVDFAINDFVDNYFKYAGIENNKIVDYDNIVGMNGVVFKYKGEKSIKDMFNKGYFYLGDSYYMKVDSNVTADELIRFAEENTDLLKDVDINKLKVLKEKLLGGKYKYLNSLLHGETDTTKLAYALYNELYNNGEVTDFNAVVNENAKQIELILEKYGNEYNDKAVDNTIDLFDKYVKDDVVRDAVVVAGDTVFLRGDVSDTIIEQDSVIGLDDVDVESQKISYRSYVLAKLNMKGKIPFNIIDSDVIIDKSDDTLFIKDTLDDVVEYDGDLYYKVSEANGVVEYRLSPIQGNGGVIEIAELYFNSDGVDYVVRNGGIDNKVDVLPSEIDDVLEKLNCK